MLALFSIDTGACYSFTAWPATQRPVIFTGRDK